MLLLLRQHLSLTSWTGCCFCSNLWLFSSTGELTKFIDAIASNLKFYQSLIFRMLAVFGIFYFLALFIPYEIKQAHLDCINILQSSSNHLFINFKKPSASKTSLIVSSLLRCIVFIPIFFAVSIWMMVSSIKSVSSGLS